MAEHIGEDAMEVSDLIEALGDRGRAVPASDFDASASDAGSCGVYAWWADEDARQLIGDTLGAAANPLIYVGKTKQTLKRRVLRTHLNGNIRNSTLRWSLTAILMETAAFADAHPDARAIRRSPSLSDWMREHLDIAIAAIAPGHLDDAERAIMAHYDPPLNLQGVARTPARDRLTGLRRQIRWARDGGERPQLR